VRPFFLSSSVAGLDPQHLVPGVGNDHRWGGYDAEHAPYPVLSIGQNGKTFGGIPVKNRCRRPVRITPRPGRGTCPFVSNHHDGVKCIGLLRNPFDDLPDIGSGLLALFMSRREEYDDNGSAGAVGVFKSPALQVDGTEQGHIGTDMNAPVATQSQPARHKELDRWYNSHQATKILTRCFHRLSFLRYLRRVLPLQPVWIRFSSAGATRNNRQDCRGHNPS